MLKTYVISLDYPTQLMATLPSKGLLPIWSPGVQGSALTEKEIRQNTTALCAAICTRPCIGIGMAHLNAWTSMLRNNDNYALIVEDDVTFVPDFYEKLMEALQHAPIDFDMLYLGCFGCTSDSSLLTVVGKAVGLIGITSTTESVNSYFDRPSTVVGAHAYIVSKKGAKTLLHHIKGQLWTHIDYCIQPLITSKKVDAYVIRPRIAFQTSTDTTTSTNTMSIYPYVLQRAVKGVYLDDAFSANYALTVIIAQIGLFPITFTSLLFLIVGVVAAFYRVSAVLLTVAFLVFSLPDFVVGSNLYSIMLHYLLLVGPCFNPYRL